MKQYPDLKNLSEIERINLFEKIQKEQIETVLKEKRNQRLEKKFKEQMFGIIT